jgi:hypothetical protein
MGYRGRLSSPPQSAKRNIRTQEIKPPSRATIGRMLTRIWKRKESLHLLRSSPAPRGLPSSPVRRPERASWRGRPARSARRPVCTSTPRAICTPAGTARPGCGWRAAYLSLPRGPWSIRPRSPCPGATGAENGHRFSRSPLLCKRTVHTSKPCPQSKEKHAHKRRNSTDPASHERDAAIRYAESRLVREIAD